MWWLFALLSAVFAALTSILAKVGIENVDSTLATAIRTVAVVGMPLRYNYDKPEKTRISRVFGYLARFFILFQTEKSSREVVIS